MVSRRGTEGGADVRKNTLVRDITGMFTAVLFNSRGNRGRVESHQASARGTKLQSIHTTDHTAIRFLIYATEGPNWVPSCLCSRHWKDAGEREGSGKR